MTRARSALSAAVLLVLALSGCASQIDALGPVSGEGRTTLRIAVIDVLVANGIAMSDVPVCEPDAATNGAYNCSGVTADGEPILAASPDGVTFSVTVDGAVVFEGNVDDVIDPSGPADQ